MTEPRIPPHDDYAEHAVLGDMLQGHHIPPLTADDFYRGAHRVIFEAMLRLEAKGERRDLLTVKTELERMERLRDVGGASYLAKLTSDIPIAVDSVRHAEHIKQKAILWKIIKQCEPIAEMAYLPGAEAQEVLDQFQAMALGIDGKGSTGSTLMELSKWQLKQIERASQNKKELLGIPTGFKELNHLTLGWQAPELIVIAARPSQGKTALGLDTAKAAAKNEIKVYFASLEMSAQQLTTRLLSSECGISGQALRLGRFPKGEWSRIFESCGRLSGLEIIIDDTSAITEMELARRVRRVKPDLLIVDYLQLMRSAQKADRKDLEVTNITAGLKSFAKEINIPVILLSQLNREIERRNNPRPRLSDLRESGAIEQDANVVLFIYRDPKNPGKAELICRKQRNGPQGTIGLAFREELASFADLAKK